MLKVNYQIMNDSCLNERGKYVPDIQKLKDSASTWEEVKYIDDLVKWYKDRERYSMYFEFAYNMVYIIQMQCGHFEIFQTPCNLYHPLEKTLLHAAEYAKKSKCSHCISNWKAGGIKCGES